MSEAAQLESVIEAAWEARAELSPSTPGETRQAVEQALALLDRGRDRALNRHGDLTVQMEVGSGYGWSGAINALKWKKGDLLVMGSSTLGGFHRVFIGPSTNQILRHSPVPVLLSTV